MGKLIDFFINRYKSTILLFLLIFLTGFTSYMEISKESEPDIEIPYIWVNVFLEGVSPEDAEKLIVKPLEVELRDLQNLKAIEGNAKESGGSVFLEFEPGTDTQIALADVRDAVTIAKAELPPSAEEPTIREFSIADESPIINLTLSGEVSERVLSKVADEAQMRIKAISEVMDVEISGQRDEMIEISVPLENLQVYDISPSQAINLFRSNDALIPAGSLVSEQGSYSFKVPGSVDGLDEMLDMPVKVFDNSILRMRDVAQIKRVYKAPSSFSRVNGKPAITLEVKKRTGENILETAAKVRSTIDEMKAELPDFIEVRYTYDDSEQVQELLDDLEGNIISSVVLVALVILLALGFRNSLLVGLAIPGAFLMGIIILHASGISINMVVLFGLIMSVGMLVDGAIVVSEYADKMMLKGMDKREAFRESSKRMTMPIISSTATTLAAFFPLLFWPGTTGQFMMYLPLTLIVTLASSIVMALIFIPTLGGKFGKTNRQSNAPTHSSQARGIYRLYLPVLRFSVNHPFQTLMTATVISFLVMFSYVSSNAGMIFFPSSNSDTLRIAVKADGDFTLYEKDDLVREVEQRLMQDFDEVVENFNVSVGGDEGTIGNIRLTFIDWQQRPDSSEIASRVRETFKDLKGLKVEVLERRGGPTSGKQLQLELSSNHKEELYGTVRELHDRFAGLGYLVDLENSLPISGLQWNFNVDRESAALYGTSVGEVGGAIQMLSTGVKVSEYRPDDLDEEIDVRIRLPREQRSVETLDRMTVSTAQGQIPLSSFVEQRYSGKVTSIYRLNGMETIKLEANLEKGVKLYDKMGELRAVVESVIGKDGHIQVRFAGDQEEQDDTQAFLTKAFMIAVFIMFMILVAQFNSYYQTFIVLSAIIFSTIGVFGLLYLLDEPFGLVMGGIGVISLAGIVINNNIVLIDTYNEKLSDGLTHREAAVETGFERLRPVFLTTLTTILGLLPMALKLNINLISGVVQYDSPSSQFWYQLAFSIIGGMGFAFFITLFVTPALLVMFKKKTNRRSGMIRRLFVRFGLIKKSC